VTIGLGSFGESWAAAHLARQGYEILERNVRFRSGEIDIVARDGPELVFVEVKSRRSSAFGPPEASITESRYARLASAIGEYLERRAGPPTEFRIDVVAIEVDRSGRVTRCEVIKGAESPQS
jgi:putative endonuclease